MIFYDMQEFGGLEEYAVSLAIGLQDQGHQVSALSTEWVMPDNQYLKRLKAKKLPFVQIPRLISLPASDWETKEKILATTMRILSPFVYMLAVIKLIVSKQTWQHSRSSAGNWLQGQLMRRMIGPDRREWLGRLLLDFWRYYWKPDLLHVQGYTTNLLFVIEWAHRKNVPVVYEEHQTPDAQFDWWQGFKEEVNKADRVIAVSEKSAEALRTVCGITQPIVVRSPLLPDPLSPGWQKNGRSLNGAQPIRVTTTARLYVSKGLTYFLEAIYQVKAAYPAAEFRVYGDGELLQDLLDFADSLGLDGEAIFVGPYSSRDELHRIMTETDIFVSSSVLEGKPLAVVEAMAYGTPIVATTVGGIPELIEDGVNGLLCAPRDSSCLATKIISLIEDPSLRKSLGSAARQSYVDGPFQPAAVATHFTSIYQDVLGVKQAS